MGVKGLWKLIELSGVPVPLETLEHKILGVDVSIWLHQAVRGFRGPGGAAVANAHLLTLFHRICKLLFYHIRPVFVFDGGVPHLKKQTLASRRLRREVAASKAKQVRERLLSNLLKSQAVRKALGRSGPGPSLVHVARPKKVEKDIFELPPLPEESKALIKSEDSDDEDKKFIKNYRLPNLHQFEFEGEEFKSLPLERQHDILSELQDTRKENSWNTLNEMPQESTSFAEFQMGRLMKRRKFQSTLDDVREEMRKMKAVEMETEMFGELERHVSLTQRIASEDSAHSIFIKKIQESNKEVANLEDIKNEDKGKSPLKKRKREEFERDFLSELEKQGIFKSKQMSDSETDSDIDDDYYQLGESGNDRKAQDGLNFDGQALLQVVSNLLDNDGLSQEEILALIKQGSPNETEVNTKDADDGPSTSGNASGFVFNPDVDSSDDDSDFIEVSKPSSPVLLDEIETKNDSQDITVDNVKKVLETKNSSLWIKIMQQRLDDIVHTSNIKKSPKKALLDSRSIGTSKRETTPKSNVPVTPNAVAISLDLDVKPLRMEDDIFADIFLESSMNTVPSKEEKPKEKAISTKVYPKTPAEISEFTKSSVTKVSQSGKSSTQVVSNLSNDQLLEKEMKKDNKRSVVEVNGKSNGLQRTNDDYKCKNIFRQETNANLEKLLSDTELMRSNDDRDVEEEKIVTNRRDPDVTCVKEDTPPMVSDVSHDVSLHELDDEVAADDVEMMSSSEESDSEDAKIKAPAEEKSKDSTFVTYKESESSGNLMAASCKIATVKSSKVQEKEKEAVNERVEDVKVDQASEKGLSKSSEMLYTHKTPETLEKEYTEKKSVEEVPKSPERPLKYSEDELKRLEGELASEQQTLVAQVQKVERISANLNDQMYGEAQDLLQLFGIPFLVSPMEAEAQCGYLNTINLTAGTITDDSDIFLFGGTKVYKNFFNQTKHVEFFKTDNITANLGLNRDKMITLALLTGSDYTEGIESVGAVSAMEVLAEFPGEGIECLRAFKKWWNVAHKNVTATYLTKVKQKMSQVHLPDSFPSEQVFKAYLEPEVDESKEKFSWAVPNVDALRQFTMDKFGWNRAKADEVLLPVMKKLGVKSTQMRIDSFFNNIKLVKDTQIQSKRMLDAIAKAKGEEPPTAHLKTPNTKRSGVPARKKAASKKRKVEEADEPSDEDDNVENNAAVDPATVANKKPSRTLLIDPSESRSGPEIQSDKPQSRAVRKKKNKEADMSNKTNEVKEKISSGPGRALREIADDVAPPPRKLTKEIMFESLLKKQKITQKETDKQLMEERKKLAAELLKKKAGKGTKKR